MPIRQHNIAMKYYPKKKTYFILVEGKESPTKPHYSRKQTEAEAVRLYLKNDCKHRVHILKRVDTLEPKEEG